MVILPKKCLLPPSEQKARIAAVCRGIKGVHDSGTVELERLRQPGEGRKSAVEEDTELHVDLETFIVSETRGDQQSPLR